MSVLAYLVGAWLLLIGAIGVVRTKNLLHAIVCLAVAQSGTYVLLVTVGFQWHATAPVFGGDDPKHLPAAVDPVVQALTLTDIVVSATVTALLLAIAIQVGKTHGTVDPEELRGLSG